ncbi:hypothetical protein SDC9_109885 [bioreactor metagenome]|uniref:Uncharacterized protein n=1 Tax=bioreactor metagenome TaxID=1076179 RepID=A0A645BCF4_9ZZZZ
MASVGNKNGISAQEFKSRGPTHEQETVTEVLFGDIPSFFLQTLYSGDDDRCVLRLINSRQAAGQRAVGGAIKAEGVERGRNIRNAAVIGHDQFGAAGTARLGKHRIRLHILVVDYDFAAGFDDARLGARNIRYRRPKLTRVIQTDIGDDGERRRIDHVGRVQLTAHANLQHDDICLTAQEVFKRDDGDELKLSRMIRHRLCVRTDERGNFGKQLVGNRFAVELHALVEPVDKRRDIEPCSIPGKRERFCNHCASGAFSVGSGDVNELKFALRVSDSLKQFARSLKTQPAAAPSDVMDIIHCFVIGHDIKQRCIT